MYFVQVPYFFFISTIVKKKVRKMMCVYVTVTDTSRTSLHDFTHIHHPPHTQYIGTHTYHTQPHNWQHNTVASKLKEKCNSKNKTIPNTKESAGLFVWIYSGFLFDMF